MLVKNHVGLVKCGTRLECHCRVKTESYYMSGKHYLNGIILWETSQTNKQRFAPNKHRVDKQRKITERINLHGNIHSLPLYLDWSTVRTTAYVPAVSKT